MRVAFFKHKLALLLIGAFGVFLCLCLPRFFREIRSARWPSTPGVVTRSHWHMAYFKQMPGFMPDVQYRYLVDGHAFMGTQIDFHLNREGHSSNYVESLLTQYPTGKVVSVYYDSREPTSSVLQPGIKSEQRWLLYFGFGYIVMSIIAFARVLHDYRKAVALMANRGSRPFIRLE